MIVKVQDPDVLKAIEPHQVATYLEVRGWHEQRRIDDKASLWIRRNAAGEEFEILLPLKPEFLDFPRRMYEVLETLEVAEGRSQTASISSALTASPEID